MGLAWENHLIKKFFLKKEKLLLSQKLYCVASWTLGMWQCNIIPQDAVRVEWPIVRKAHGIAENTLEIFRVVFNFAPVHSWSSFPCPSHNYPFLSWEKCNLKRKMKRLNLTNDIWDINPHSRLYLVLGKEGQIYSKDLNLSCFCFSSFMGGQEGVNGLLLKKESVEIPFILKLKRENIASLFL